MEKMMRSFKCKANGTKRENKKHINQSKLFEAKMLIKKFSKIKTKTQAK